MILCPASPTIRRRRAEMTSDAQTSDDRFYERRFSHLFFLALYHRNLEVVCRRCQRRTVFAGYQIWWLFHRKHWDDAMRTAAQRFRCTGCKGPKRIQCQRTSDEPTIQLPDPDDTAWKREVRRYRT
jgi:hypothetical protein